MEFFPTVEVPKMVQYPKWYKIHKSLNDVYDPNAGRTRYAGWSHEIHRLGRKILDHLLLQKLFSLSKKNHQLRRCLHTLCREDTRGHARWGV